MTDDVMIELQNSLSIAQAEITRLQAELDEMRKPMECGHAGRYLWGGAFPFCLRCELDRVRDVIKKKIGQAR